RRQGRGRGRLRRRAAGGDECNPGCLVRLQDRSPGHARDPAARLGSDPEGEGVKFVVNGKPVEVKANENTPLLYVLRNDLGLVGSRFGCGSGQCGACFVMFDGKPMASCDLPLSVLENKTVTTVEGLNGTVQKALLAEQAAQCGYCMSGIIISATALLARNASPSEKEIREALDKNLCRCGSHNRVVRAVMRASREQA